MTKIIDKFWDEHKAFMMETDPFDKKIRFNLKGAVERTHVWHEKYSLQYTVYFGIVYLRKTCRVLGMGAAYRSWEDVNHINKDKAAHMGAKRFKM